jgi:hypothetical protein
MVAPRRAPKKLSSKAPASVLQVQPSLFGVGANVGATRNHLKIEIFGEAGDESLVLVGGFPTKLVIHVKDKESDPKLLAEAVEQVQQAHGVSPAGDSYPHAIAGTKHSVSADRRENLAAQVTHPDDNGSKPILGEQFDRGSNFSKRSTNPVRAF